VGKLWRNFNKSLDPNPCTPPRSIQETMKYLKKLAASSFNKKGNIYNISFSLQCCINLINHLPENLKIRPIRKQYFGISSLIG
jgi:hypothetical protein